MCSRIVKTRNGPVLQRCTVELYGIVNFTDTSKQKFVYWCPHCRRVEGTSQTPEQLFAEWRRKGINFETDVFAETWKEEKL